MSDVKTQAGRPSPQRVGSEQADRATTEQNLAKVKNLEKPKEIYATTLSFNVLVNASAPTNLTPVCTFGPQNTIFVGTRVAYLDPGENEGDSRPASYQDPELADETVEALPKLLKISTQVEAKLDFPMTEFLAKSFVEDYVTKRRSLEHSGWRSLMQIVASLKIPRSRAYGEPRYGHTFGKPLEFLVRAGIVEYRRFPGKGRGGEVLKVRICYERDSMRRLVDRLAPTYLDGRSETPLLNH